MNAFLTIIGVSLSAILIENFVLVQFLGICPFLGVSKKVETAVGMGMAVTFVMTLSGIFTFFIYKYLLLPFNLEYLQTIAFILVIASLVQLVEMALLKLSPSLFKALGIYLPLITTNCAVLGVTLVNIKKSYDFITSVVYSFSAGLGFMLAIVIFSGIRERIETSNIIKPLRGFPIALISAGLLSISFLAFSGFKI